MLITLIILVLAAIFFMNGKSVQTWSRFVR